MLTLVLQHKIATASEWFLSSKIFSTFCLPLPLKLAMSNNGINKQWIRCSIIRHHLLKKFSDSIPDSDVAKGMPGRAHQALPMFAMLCHQNWKDQDTLITEVKYSNKAVSRPGCALSTYSG